VLPALLACQRHTLQQAAPAFFDSRPHIAAPWGRTANGAGLAQLLHARTHGAVARQVLLCKCCPGEFTYATATASPCCCCTAGCNLPKHSHAPTTPATGGRYDMQNMARYTPAPKTTVTTAPTAQTNNQQCNSQRRGQLQEEVVQKGCYKGNWLRQQRHQCPLPPEEKGAGSRDAARDAQALVTLAIKVMRPAVVAAAAAGPAKVRAPAQAARE
jgi:hypothetical protein